jgi:hypothetical protein
MWVFVGYKGVGGAGGKFLLPHTFAIGQHSSGFSEMDLLAIAVFGKCLASYIFVQRYFFRERIHCLVQVHRFFVAMELDLLVDDIVNELALDNKFGGEILEPPDFFRINDWCGFDVRGNVFKIVLALAPVPDPVFGEGPGIDFEEKWIQVWHTVVLGRVTKYFWI